MISQYSCDSEEASRKLARLMQHTHLSGTAPAEKRAPGAQPRLSQRRMLHGGERGAPQGILGHRQSRVSQLHPSTSREVFVKAESKYIV